jgi:hypothetical protein
MNRQPDTIVDMVCRSWQSHLDNEFCTGAAAASGACFEEVEQRRYHSRYHPVELP